MQQNKFMKKTLQQILVLLLVSLGSALVAQPATQIYLAKIKVKSSSVTVGQPKKISTFGGYNNQPLFSPNGKLLYYTSNQGKKHTGIFAYHVKSGKTIDMFPTKTSEYSPTVTPDGKYISCIMEETGGEQRLWKFPLSKKGKPQLVLKSVKPVGYHVWVDTDALVLFVLGAKGKPHTLQLASAKADKGKVLAQEPGRCFSHVPKTNQTISFVHKPKNGQWKIKQLEVATEKITDITPTLKGSEDYAWTKKGSIIMGQGTKLFVWQKGKKWNEIADFSTLGIKKITRLAINPKNNLLAVVGE